MNEAQTWTIIGGTLGLVAFGFAGMTLCLTWLKSAMDAGLDALRSEIRSARSDLTGEIRAVRSDLSGEIRALDRQVTHLEQDFREAFGFRLRVEVAPETQEQTK